MPIQGALTRENRSGATSSFIGRSQEMSDAGRMLAKTRLLTLAGVGGVGKTRLAKRLAETMIWRFRDGVTFVELAALMDGELLEPTVAAALGLHDSERHTLLDHLVDRRMLLVLDGCEHLLQPCAALVAAMLRTAPKLRILVTSRHTLGVDGEQVLPVLSLNLPDPGGTVRAIARCDAVRLLVERAAQVRPGFAVTAANAAAVARLAQRLDGIPLAIELAAVQLRRMSLEELARALDGRFDVLSGGDPAALPRHQTLRATMDWSFGLCSPGERRLWGRMSMFPGGVDLDTAETVCAYGELAGEDIVDLVAGLVDMSVLTSERRSTGIRYCMLDSLRAYGLERLTAPDERTLRRRYCAHYRCLTDRYRIDRLVPDQLDRFQRLQLELPNARVALDTCFARPHTANTGLEIASALWAYWLLAGSLSEGRHWLERGLELVGQPSRERITALWVYGLLSIYQGDLGAAEPRVEQCHRLARQSGDEPGLAFATMTSGIAALCAGDGKRGLSLLEDARARHQATGDAHAVGLNLYLATVFGTSQSPDLACALGEELLALSEARNAPLFRTYALFAIGVAAWKQGDWRRAEAIMRGVAAPCNLINDRWGLAQCLEVLAWTAGAHGRHGRAARLLGAADALWQAIDLSPSRLPYHVQSHQLCEARALRALGDRAFTDAFGRGSDLRPDHAIAYALADDDR
jgi:predicted ATPase